MAFIDDFKARFPEFSTSQVDTYMPSLEDVWPCYYGGSYSIECDKEIILNLVAHLLVGEVNTASSASQTVASQSVGSVSQSFLGLSSVNQSDMFFMSTKYGQRYLLLISKNIGAYFI